MAHIPVLGRLIPQTGHDAVSGLAIPAVELEVTLAVTPPGLFAITARAQTMENLTVFAAVLTVCQNVVGKFKNS